MTSLGITTNLATAIPSPRRKAQHYVEDRPSAVWGIATLPAHWREKPLKRVASINTDKLPDATDPDYEMQYVDIGNVTLEAGIVSTERFRFEAAPSRARRIVRDGDTIVSTVRTYLKAVAQINNPPGNLVVSTGFAVVRAGPELDPGYLYRLAQSEPFVERIMAYSVGVSYPAINASDVGAFPIPLPPLREQRAIAAFLDRETAKIDELIAKKEKLRALLHEKRTALIERAVSKLSPQLFKLRRALSQRPKNGISPPPGVSGEGVPTFSIAAVRNGTIDIFNNLKVAAISKTEASPYLVRRGDVLVVRGNANQSLVGMCGIVSEHPEHCVYPDLLIRLTPHRNVDSRYLVLVLNSGIVRSQIESLARTANGTLKISGADVCSLQLPIPSIEVQTALLRDMDREATKLDQLSGTISTHIGLLKAHRASLVTAAVTGQIDVRSYHREAPCQ